jgi:Tfp pilus assembly protein PilX
VKEKGVALIAGLVLLAAISLLALMAASGMVLQKHMATNFQQDAQALENAGIATAYASTWLFSRANHEREAGCVSSCVLPVAIGHTDEVPTQPEYEDAAWWREHGVEAGFDPITTGMLMSYEGYGSEPPHWITEELHYEPLAGGLEDGTEGIAYYRVLGRGTGNAAAKVAVTESILARPWGGDYQLLEFLPGVAPAEFCRQFSGITHPQFKCCRRAWRQRL